MRRTVNRSGLDSDDDVDVQTEASEPVAEWTEESKKGNLIITTVGMQIQ